MSSPVRVVCRGCLRSVEIEGEGSSFRSGMCPFCGQVLDSRQTFGVGTDEQDVTRAADDAPRVSGSEWVATWSRGSFGSLGRFQIRDRLGDGGFGEVYLAYDPRLDRDVALKVLRQDSPSDRVMERFFREARAAARLDHPNIVAVYDSGFDQGRCWVAYQRVQGKPLWWYFDHQPISPREAARMLRDLAEAVDYAHKNGVFHRDIKPANILVDADTLRPRLIDFGLSRRSDMDSGLTRDGTVIGTPAYMSPEQAQGYSRQVDERSDVFSLGVVLYEALGGRRLDAITTVRSPAQIKEGAEARPSVEDWAGDNPPVPAGLVRICRKAAAERPDDRYPNARAVADDLDAWLREEATHPVPKPRDMSTLALASWSVLATVILCVVSFVVARNSTPVTPEPEGPPVALARLATSAIAPIDTAKPATPPPAVKTSTSVAKPANSSPVVANSIGLVGNKSTKNYHRASCWTIRSMTKEHRTDFTTADEAVLEGYAACQTCNPENAPKGDRRSKGKP